MNSTRITSAALVLLAAVEDRAPSDMAARIEAGDVAVTVERSWWRTRVTVRLVAQDQKSPRRRVDLFG